MNGLTCQKLELKIIPVYVFLICSALLWIISLLLPTFNYSFAGMLPVVIVFLLCGFSLILSGFSKFQHVHTSASPSQPESASALVTTGIYRFTRNPMYLGGALILTAQAFFVSNGLAFIGIPIFALYLNQFQIKPEERILLSKFGQSYLDYTQKTRRWF